MRSLAWHFTEGSEAVGHPGCARSPDLGETSINSEGLARDVVGGVGEEERGGSGDVPSGSLATKGNGSAVPVGLDEAGESSERCVDEPGHDDIDSHSSRSCLFGDVRAQP